MALNSINNSELVTNYWKANSITYGDTDGHLDSIPPCIRELYPWNKTNGANALPQAGGSIVPPALDEISSIWQEHQEKQK